MVIITWYHVKYVKALFTKIDLSDLRCGFEPRLSYYWCIALRWYHTVFRVFPVDVSCPNETLWLGHTALYNFFFVRRPLPMYCFIMRDYLVKITWTWLTGFIIAPACSNYAHKCSQMFILISLKTCGIRLQVINHATLRWQKQSNTFEAPFVHWYLASSCFQA